MEQFQDNFSEDLACFNKQNSDMLFKGTQNDDLIQKDLNININSNPVETEEAKKAKRKKMIIGLAIALGLITVIVLTVRYFRKKK